MEKPNQRRNKTKRAIVARPKQQQKLNKLAKRLEQMSIGNTHDYVAPARITDFRKYGRNDLLRELQIYNKHLKDRYLLGLVHPDVAVEEQLAVKLYADIPLPSAGIGFREQYQFTTSAAGTFLLSWMPNYVMTTNDIQNSSATDYSHLNFNNNATLTGSSVNAFNFFVGGSYQPATTIQRYRLVSALIKVQYNGTVLNQSGTMLSCATFDPLVVATGNGVTAVNTYTNPLVDRYGNFSLIANGLWNRTVDITTHGNGLEALYVPTDPLDYTFQRQGRFYGNTSPATGTVQAPTDGAHIAYLFAGRNLPAANSCILVEIFYNYEVIPDPTSAPILRGTVDNVYSPTDRDEIHNNLVDVVKSGGLIREATKNSSTFMDLLTMIGQYGMKYIPKVLNAASLFV